MAKLRFNLNAHILIWQLVSLHLHVEYNGINGKRKMCLQPRIMDSVSWHKLGLSWLTKGFIIIMRPSGLAHTVTL